MKVVRIITYEGTEEQLELQLKNSAVDGVWKIFAGKLKNLTMTIKTIEEPNSDKVHKALNYHPRQWPVPEKRGE
jgi:hypothetical protein